MENIELAAGITPLPAGRRAGRVPRHGYASMRPAERYQDALIGGNGTIETKTFGDPRREVVMFRHEEMVEPDLPAGRCHPPEPPEISSALGQVRELLLAGEYKRANDYAFDAIRAAGYPDRIPNNPRHEGFVLHIDILSAHEGDTAGINDYLRTVDFRTGEAVVSWRDSWGYWERRSFVSRPEGIAVMEIRVPPEFGGSVRFHIAGTMHPESGLYEPRVDFRVEYAGVESIVEARYLPEALKDAGYCSVLRIGVDKGKVLARDNGPAAQGANRILILTALDWRQPYESGTVEDLRKKLGAVSGDYECLLRAHENVQGPLFDRAVLSLAAEDERLLTTEELLIQNQQNEGFSPALIEKVFDMGRYFLLYSHGRTPYVWGHVNINVNLQVASGVQASLHEMMEVYFRWIEGMHRQWRENARAIFGFRGFLSSVHPDARNAVLFHMTPLSPHHYWVAGAGWCYQPFWEYYQATGDETFARERIFPALREIAWFFEDYLTLRDEAGSYIFAPSYSPENWPWNLDQTQCVVINSVMDIAVCREVLSHLLELCHTLHIEDTGCARWREILDHMPRYLYDDLGALKEWAWPGLPDRFDHRHLSHLYGVWPGDEIRPDICEDLARAAMLANRKRAQGNASIHGIMHRALAAARLRDSFLPSRNLKQVLDQGYLNAGSMMTNHNPYRTYCPDACGSLPVLLIEMLVYSRPGVIELLPTLSPHTRAMPPGLDAGLLKGIASRTRAVIEYLQWGGGDGNRGGYVEVKIRSLVSQPLELRSPLGLETVSVELAKDETWSGSFTFS